MLIYDICVRRNYEKDGERRVKWHKVGIMTMVESGKKYIRLFHQPHTEFFVFEPKVKPEAPQEENKSEENKS
jgi:hypothetical protein